MVVLMMFCDQDASLAVLRLGIVVGGGVWMHAHCMVVERRTVEGNTYGRRESWWWCSAISTPAWLFSKPASLLPALHRSMYIHGIMMERREIEGDTYGERKMVVGGGGGGCVLHGHVRSQIIEHR